MIPSGMWNESASKIRERPLTAEALHVYQDRGLIIPAGAVIRTGYVPIHRVMLACRDRMAVGDVEASYRKLLALGEAQPWPCPNGHWADDGFFVIMDGRHQYVASLMLGIKDLLVAWIENPNEKQSP